MNNQNAAVKMVIDHIGGKDKEVAEKLRVTPTYLSMLKNGFRPVTPEFAVKAEIETKGAVKRAEILPEIFGELDYTQDAA